MNRIQQQDGVKAGVLYYMEDGKVESETIVYLIEQEAQLVDEINQAGIELMTKQFVIELRDKYGIKTQENE